MVILQESQLEHINTFREHPAGQSSGKYKHTLWIPCRIVNWNTWTHFVDVLQESQAKHINTLCRRPAGESYETHKHTSWTSCRTVIWNTQTLLNPAEDSRGTHKHTLWKSCRWGILHTQTHFWILCRRVTWNTQTSLMDILQRFRSLNLALDRITLSLNVQLVAYFSRNLLRNLRQVEIKNLF